MNENTIYAFYLSVGIGFPLYIILRLRSESSRLKLRIKMISKMTTEQKQMEISKIQYELYDFKVNHLLHFIISVVTGSLWAFFVWIPLTIINRMNRSKLERLMVSI